MSDKVSVLGPEQTQHAPVSARRPARFKRKERAALERYVRTVANQMGLRDWTLEIEWDVAAAEDADATISVLYGRRFATIRFAREFRKATPDNQRYTIVHELLHCHFADMDQFVERCAEELLGQVGSTAVMVGYNQASETAVDTIASGWVSTIPLPKLR